MIECEFRKHLNGRGLSVETIDFSVTAVEELEKYIRKNGTTFSAANCGVLKDYVSSLIEAGGTCSILRFYPKE